MLNSIETIKPEHFNPNVVNSGGVCAHSDNSSTQEFIIFCVGNNATDDENFKLWAIKNNIGFKPLIGSYKGISETAFIINSKHHEALKPWIKNEESILNLGELVKGKRKATLVFTDNSIQNVDLGYFKYTSKQYALKQEAWTFDQENNAYYIAE